MRRAGRVAELCDWVRVHKPAQPQQLADALPSIELQLGRAGREEQSPQLAGAE